MPVNLLADEMEQNKQPINLLADDENIQPSNNGNLLEKFKNAARNATPSLPPGINMATGMMSLAFPGKQGEMVANLPQVMRGTQPTTSESASQTIGQFLPGLEVGAPVSKFGKGVMNVLNQKNPKELAYGIQKAHDVLKSQASDIYDLVKSEVKPRGVNEIKIPEKIIESAESYLPKTDASKNLINKAKSGDYESLHKLQSDLGKRGTKHLGSDYAADWDKGEEMLEVKDKIMDSIKNHFNEYGHEDLSKLLDMAKGKWAKLKDVYYSHPAIAKLVHEESRKVPKNPMNVFSEESKPMQKILNEHPEISEALNKHKDAEKFISRLKKTGKVGLYGTGGLSLIGAPLYGAYKLIDLLKGEE